MALLRTVVCALLCFSIAACGGEDDAPRNNGGKGAAGGASGGSAGSSGGLGGVGAAAGGGSGGVGATAGSGGSGGSATGECEPACGAGEVCASGHCLTPHYLGPNGDDANPGTEAAPWKTFAYAIPKLEPGHALVLLDGTYDDAGSGYPAIDCAESAENGSEQSRIAIIAQNERGAHLAGKGTGVAPFLLRNCSFWIVQGLRVSNTPNADDYNYNMVFTHTTDVLIRRNLVHQVNWGQNCDLATYTGCNNVHALGVDDSERATLEENEVYDFHRHGFHLSGTDGSIVRRNYCNTRMPVSNSRGNCLVIYPGNDNILENNISEGTSSGASMEGVSWTTHSFTHRNKFLGNISLGEGGGQFAECREDSLESLPKDAVFQDLVVANTVSGGSGIYLKSVRDATIKNVTVVNSEGHGLVAATDTSCASYNASSSVTATNVLVAQNQIGVVYATGGGSLDYSVAYQNADAPYDLSAGSYTNTNSNTTTDPSLGGCVAFIRKSSPLRGAGLGGADIGANVAYAYENGNLTNKPLWDPVTKELDIATWGGVVISGVNDTNGKASIGSRLHPNCATADFPY